MGEGGHVPQYLDWETLSRVFPLGLFEEFKSSHVIFIPLVAIAKVQLSTASVSVGLCPPDPLPGFCPCTPLGDFRLQTPCYVLQPWRQLDVYACLPFLQFHVLTSEIQLEVGGYMTHLLHIAMTVIIFFLRICCKIPVDVWECPENSYAPTEYRPRRSCSSEDLVKNNSHLFRKSM